jgi:hypothetical protein
MSCKTFESRRFPTVAALLTVALATLITSQAMAQPGSAIVTVPLAVPGEGVSVANNCEGEIYYTHTDATLYKTDAAGANLGSVAIIDAASGARVVIDEMAWDESRQILWGQEHDSNPVDVYTINATTGAATFAFTAANTISAGTFRDGIAYDATDDSLWLTGDVSTTVEHYTTAGAFLGQITPTNAGGGTLGSISGVSVGVGDLLYLGRNGAVEIVQVTKSTGAFITSFASPAGTRDEGLECDAFSFAPTLALWSREFNSPGDITAIEIEPGSCECGGGAILTCTLGFWKNHPEDWASLDPDDAPAWGGGLTYMEIFNTSPKKGDASVMLAHAYIAAVLNTGADAGDLADALALLTVHPVGSGDLTAGKNAHPDRAVALAVMESLQGFNESSECPL